MTPTIPLINVVQLTEQLEAYARRLHDKATGVDTVNDYQMLTTRSMEIRRVNQLLQVLVERPDTPIEELTELLPK